MGEDHLGETLVFLLHQEAVSCCRRHGVPAVPLGQRVFLWGARCSRGEGCSRERLWLTKRSLQGSQKCIY